MYVEPLAPTLVPFPLILKPLDNKSNFTVVCADSPLLKSPHKGLLISFNCLAVSHNVQLLVLLVLLIIRKAGLNPVYTNVLLVELPLPVYCPIAENPFLGAKT